MFSVSFSKYTQRAMTLLGSLAKRVSALSCVVWNRNRNKYIYEKSKNIVNSAKRRRKGRKERKKSKQAGNRPIVLLELEFSLARFCAIRRETRASIIQRRESQNFNFMIIVHR